MKMKTFLTTAAMTRLASTLTLSFLNWTHLNEREWRHLFAKHERLINFGTGNKSYMACEREKENYINSSLRSNKNWFDLQLTSL